MGRQRGRKTFAVVRAGSQRPDYGKCGEGVKQTGSSALGVALTRSTDDLSMQGGEGILENS